MPFVRIETNRDFPQKVINEVITQITQRVHEDKGDPESMILVVINTKVNVSFGGNYRKAAAAVQLFNLKMPLEITTKLTESISDILLDKFGIPAERMYIFFQEFTEMHLVGWNRKTFAQIVGGDDVKPLEQARENQTNQ